MTKRFNSNTDNILVNRTLFSQPDFILVLIVFYRLSNVDYGPVCANNWSEEWSQETCQQMNKVGVNQNSIIQKPMESDQYFSINATLSIDNIYSVQEARSNYDESCENSIGFDCESFGN